MIQKKHGGRKVNSCFVSFLVIVNFDVLYSCDEKKNLRIYNFKILARPLRIYMELGILKDSKSGFQSVYRI